MYFEAKLGIGPNSDIAIDDVFFDEGKCGQKTGGLKLTGTNPIAGLSMRLTNIQMIGTGVWHSLGLNLTSLL